MSSTAPRTINAYAALASGEAIKPWKYESRPLGPEDVEIKISHCGICGTDVHVIGGGWGPLQEPCVPGHEIVGEVTIAGAEVKDLQIGDRVGVGAMVWACLNKDPNAPCKACATGADAYCPHVVWTYSHHYADGKTSYGGYAEYVRVAAAYAFKIPDIIQSDVAAPLLCAGVTVFTPLKEAGVKAGDRVGVVGIGGLGHLALQFAKALGATVIAFSRTANKKEEARRLGADEFVNYGDAKEAEKAAGSVDLLLMTADAKEMPYDLFLSFLGFRGTLVMIGVPEDELKLYPYNLVSKGHKIVGSAIGSIADIKDMLKLASEKNVRPVIQKLPMSDVNKGIQMVRDGTVRYRVVLEN